ncbi:MAG: ABC transporter ATP-binding protein [Eubacterium sp.]
MDCILKTKNLTKVYGKEKVVNNVNLNIKRGEIYGLLGGNGAGKTTIMKMMTTLVKPTEGSIDIFGKDLASNAIPILKNTGALIEYPVFYDHLTAKEVLRLHCSYMGIGNDGDIEEVLDLLDLSQTNDKKVKMFSLGMKQRLGIARAMLTKPKLLILDEPINGLDPRGIREVREILKNLRDSYDTTIVISSHILAEIEQVADTIGIIAKGTLIEEISMDEVRQENTEYIELKVDNTRRAKAILKNLPSIGKMEIMDENQIRIFDFYCEANELLKLLIDNNVIISEFSKKITSLEEHFLKITKGGNQNV